MTLLSINAGSSSLKVALFDDLSLESPVSSLAIEGIGTEQAVLVLNNDQTTEQTIIANSPDEAAQVVKQYLTDELAVTPESITAIGYRVVHGGAKYTQASRIDDELISYLESITPLAPNHMPATLSSIRAFDAAYPDTPHVACFDTSFFHDIPEVAKTLPISKNLQDEHGIRRYGFHGLSYESLLDSFQAHEGEQAKNGRVIMAHLGSGASVCAVKNGKPLDMSMGFTPISGIMMSTRSGDIEPGVLTYLQSRLNLSTEALSDLVTYQSGLKGVSEVSNNMQELLAIQSTSSNAALAVELFCYKIRKQIGAYAAVLGGVDSIIFSGGIGERSDEVRATICEGLSFLGVTIDVKRNQDNARLISADGAGVGVHVIAAREDASIVKQTIASLSN